MAQKLSLSGIELVHDKLVVYYSLEDNNTNHEYQVSLYSSKDNYAAPLTKVTGDVGAEVKPGREKKMEWSILQELGIYKGELAVEVRAHVFIPFVKIADFDVTKKYKRGKSYPLGWKSGNMGGHLDIELFEGQKRIPIERNVPNTGKYEWFIPGSVRPGNDYKLKLTNTRNHDESVVLGPFRVVHRVPLLVKGGALALLGAGIYVIYDLLDKPTVEDPLGRPPDLPPND